MIKEFEKGGGTFILKVEKILCEALSKTFHLVLSIGFRAWLFKAYYFASKRLNQASPAGFEKETLIKKLTLTYASILKKYKVDKVALQIQTS